MTIKGKLITNLSIIQVQLIFIPSYRAKARNMQLLTFWACYINCNHNLGVKIDTSDIIYFPKCW